MSDLGEYMLIPPLLQSSIVENIAALLKSGDAENEIPSVLKKLSLIESSHTLRFLFNKPEFSDAEIAHLLQIWYTIVPPTHNLDTVENRKALYAIGQWWDTFGQTENFSYDELECLLDALGASPEGKAYFEWVALSPTTMMQKKVIWDEDRRGAIVSLGKYAYCRENEVFLAHYLDDAHIIQIEVIRILAALKSRLLAKLAPWYIQNDDLLRPILQEYF
jgi:hypothetical protein